MFVTIRATPEQTSSRIFRIVSVDILAFPIAKLTCNNTEEWINYFDQGVLIHKSTFFFASGVAFLLFAFVTLAVDSFFFGSVFELEPTLNEPIPPDVTGFGPSIPPIPAILPCFASRVGPLVTGMNADECAASRAVTAIHLNASEENILVVVLGCSCVGGEGTTREQW